LTSVQAGAESPASRCEDPRAGLDDMQKKKILDPKGARNSTPLSSSPQPVAVQTELLWLFILLLKYKLQESNIRATVFSYNILRLDDGQ
jgi:hypothetical protein